MDNFSASSPASHEQEHNPLPGETVVVPPKFQKAERSNNIWLRSVTSLALYLILGYFVFHNFFILLLITAIVVIHELGHFFAMKYFHYNDLGIFFIPLLGAYVSGSKQEVSQRQSAIILLAGPLPGILFGIVLYLIDKNSAGIYLFDIPLTRIAWLFMILNLINLFPVYPLDGGQLMNRVFLDESSIWSKVFVFLSAALMCWVAWKIGFYPLLIFPALMLFRLRTDTQFDAIEKKIESDGINTDIAYEDLPDIDYWKIRDILVREYPPFKDLQNDPPYTYSGREEKVMTTVQGLLHRQLIQDISVWGKLLILLICLAVFAAPWLLQMDMSFFQQLGF